MPLVSDRSRLTFGFPPKNGWLRLYNWAWTNAGESMVQIHASSVVELEQLLRDHQGNLGELFGVTRQVAGEEPVAWPESAGAAALADADADR